MVWIRREDLEDRELRSLSPWAAMSRNHGGRRIVEAEDSLRTAFQRDRDRVLHSAAFRRLQGKTQVVAAFEGDHFRSRMTHSLEVSQIARSTATALSLNADLAEAIALAHDLGHPPFGHVGEEALHELMHDHGGFRHNAQGARIVDYLEDRYGHGHGLNLTVATRRSLLKGRVPDGFPLAIDLQQKQSPPLEAHVVDLCDKIAYLSHDLDDGLRAELFTVEDARSLRLWQWAAASAGTETRLRVVSDVVGLMIHDLVETTDRALSARTTNSEPPRIAHGPEMAVAANELLEFLRERFYRSPRVLLVMRDGAERIRRRFAMLLADPGQLPSAQRERVPHDGLPRVVCDYLAGMTDRYLLLQA
ncbi:MAG: dNTP triphosphohydrolase [Planctomycetes bacterium]|jgi:dGTPase|nr:dNTP triphosphohydrolase [Planctomycetota bacterium]